jgi:predicted patatin/cPLA2 family phospholipase
VADPIPIRRAIKDGATEITVVLTHNPANGLKPIPRWLGRLAFPEFPKVARVWTALQNVYYNDALDLMRKPPAGVRIQVFHPLQPLPLSSLSVEPARIAAALVRGHDEALQQMELSEANPLAGAAQD